MLEAAAQRFGLRLGFESGLIGGAAIDAEGAPLSERTLALAKQSSAVLLGYKAELEEKNRWREAPPERPRRAPRAWSRAISCPHGTAPRALICPDWHAASAPGSAQ